MRGIVDNLVVPDHRQTNKQKQLRVAAHKAARSKQPNTLERAEDICIIGTEGGSSYIRWLLLGKGLGHGTCQLGEEGHSTLLVCSLANLNGGSTRIGSGGMCLSMSARERVDLDRHTPAVPY